jgi:hypothetical protein
MSNIKLFEDTKIRSQWDAGQEHGISQLRMSLEY